MGVIDRRKNFGVLVQAWKKVSEDSDIQLEIFGEGGLRHEVEADWREVAPPHKQQAVLFQGWCQTPLQNLKGVSLLVHPALHEGVSNAVLEALSLGIPVLASDISEHRELFGLPDGGGNLVNPHDPAQWAERVLAFFKQVEYQREVATIGEATIERLTFDWSQRVFDVTRF
jgi:glycosyltransferase involved in cell wall biosynthesis